MKKFSLTFILFFSFLMISWSQDQSDAFRRSFYEKEWQSRWASQLRDSLETDTSVDIKFYSLDVKISVDSEYISGNVLIRLNSLKNNLNTVKLNLRSSLTVDSVNNDASSFTTEGDIVNVNLIRNFNKGEEVTLRIYYHGIPELAGGMKGLVYTSHHINEPVIATLSTPFLSHYWWPCKDGPSDKADSVRIDITIKDTIINGIPLIAVSNGVLTAIDSISQPGLKTFHWKHGYPVVPYYVMAAISNYRTITQTYSNATSTYPLIHYVFDESYNSSLEGVEGIPQALDMYSSYFGDYPFKSEKYGMTQLGFYGAIENQTNTIINTMEPNWYSVSVHELAHMWFGDMITCSDWHHGWINEGFASYCEALLAEYTGGTSAYREYMKVFEYYKGGTVYLPSDTGAFNIFQEIIYYKGAFVLHMLRGVLGDSVFFRCMKDYVSDNRFRYKHASTEDFREVCENVSGQDLGDFFDQWIYDSYYPKYKYNFISYPEKDSSVVTIVQMQGPEQGWRPVFKMPLELLISFKNSPDTLVRVNNDQQYQNYYFSLSDTIKKITIDLDKWVLKSAIFSSSIHVSSDDIENDDLFTVFPNPARENVYVEYHLSTNAESITIADISGRIIRNIPLKERSGKLKSDNLEKGIYFFMLKTKTGKVLTRKVISE